jgi:SOS-response transcriptional repressor LexA
LGVSRFFEWLQYRTKLFGFQTQNELSEASGISIRTVSGIYTSKTIAKTERSTRVWLARTLRVSVTALEQLDRGEVEWIGDEVFQEWEQCRAVRPINAKAAVAPSGRGTRILGKVTAGGLVESFEFPADDDSFIPLTFPTLPEAFALEIAGDSMAPVYQPGEVIILTPIPPDQLQSGEDVMVQLNGAADGKSCFKRAFVVGNGMLSLISLNPRYAPMLVPFDQVIRVGRLIGKYTPAAKLPAK